MRRSTIGIILALALGCLVAPRAAEAQQPVKVHRIGVLSLASAASNEAFAIEALRQGLRELGYVEGQNLTLEVRWAEGRHERLDDLAAELVRLPVDLIVTAGPGSGAARRATTTLPIVVAFMGYGQGSVESQARPGGNLTGLFMPGSELEAKRLELLKEAFPGVTRVAVLLEAASPIKPTVLRALEPMGQELGVTLQLVEVHGPDDFERAFSAIAHGDAEALVVAAQPLLDRHAERIRDFMVAQRLPTIGGERPYLMAYRNIRGSGAAMWRRAAVFIDKILHGARPGDLPMEQAAEFELTIDLHVAQELGLTLPESLLLRADKVFPVSGGVPLPASRRIVPPDRRVTPEVAAFSGKWFGTWEGDMQGEYILVVETIDPPHALVISAFGNHTTGASTAHPLRVRSDWYRARGQFVEGTLQVSFPWGATHVYRWQPDSTLAATHTWRGETSRATMTRAQE